MKKSEVIARRDYLRGIQSFLTEEGHQELHSLSQKLIGMYAAIIDLDEIDDDEMEGASNG